jgi:predicted GTPase
MIFCCSSNLACFLYPSLAAKYCSQNTSSWPSHLLKNIPIYSLDDSKMTQQSKVVYIVVMGLTGAGKSTFISRATGDQTILIGTGLESGT